LDAALLASVGNLLLHIGGTALRVSVGADESAYFWLDNHGVVLWSYRKNPPLKGEAKAAIICISQALFKRVEWPPRRKPGLHGYHDPTYSTHLPGSSPLSEFPGRPAPQRFSRGYQPRLRQQHSAGHI